MIGTVVVTPKQCFSKLPKHKITLDRGHQNQEKNIKITFFDFFCQKVDHFVVFTPTGKI